jgi:uncharacterized lipoprotein YddW (UPF0748 family)
MKEPFKLHKGNEVDMLAIHAQVEAAPEDITITLEGQRHALTAVNTIPVVEEWLVLFTSAWGKSVIVPEDGVAVQVGTGGLVLRVVNEAPVGFAPAWSGPTELDIPEGGYVLVSCDALYAPESSRFFLSTCFRKGDRIKLRKDGAVTDHHGLAGAADHECSLYLNHPSVYTETETATIISGNVSGGNAGEFPALTVNGEAAVVDEQGAFAHKLKLALGVNFVDVEVKAGNETPVARSLAIFSKSLAERKQRIILWIDQKANSGKLQTAEAVRKLLERAKQAGVTDIALDVKGVEGYVSYFKNPLTRRPHMSELVNAGLGIPYPKLDLLQIFIEEGHHLGLSIHASMNVFAEGSIVRGQYAILDEHPEWEEMVYKHQDEGVIKRQRDSSAPGLVAFANPLNEKVREHQLAGFREVIAGYQVDGIILDRSRYDNETADFSPLTRNRYEAYLAERGKRLHRWPEDVFYYEGNTRIDGPLILDWWAFRAGVITTFVAEVKEMVEDHYRQTGSDVLLSAYVGSWFDTYYVNGANWASPDYQYDSRLQFQEGSVYTEDYRGTGYIRYLDFLMIGTYQDTLAEVEKYMALGNIATGGEVPVYAGISLNQMNSAERQREVFHSAFQYTDGLMLFDASHADWEILNQSLKRE